LYIIKLIKDIILIGSNLKMFVMPPFTDLLERNQDISMCIVHPVVHVPVINYYLVLKVC